MESDNEVSQNLGAALVVWIASFAASWVLLLLITGTSGLSLVLSVFVALIAFDLTRRSLRAGFAILGISLFVMILKGAYYLLA